MKVYSTTPPRRKQRVPNHVPKGYWQAFRNLYGRADLNIPSVPKGSNHEADHPNQQDFNHDIPLLEKRL